MEALLLVDLQNDFMPGGALAVADGDATVVIANQLMPVFDLIIATQDWHPPDHESFVTQHSEHRAGDVIDLHGLPQVLWPVHCVRGSRGAEFHPALLVERIEHVVRKGTDRTIDSYSGFFDNGHRKATGLEEFLRARGVSVLYVMGLATDYCVKFTALDAVRLGFETRLLIDGCRGVDLRAGDSARAVDEMRQAGIKVEKSSEAHLQREASPRQVAP
jgi:nicotinamidase/pyrazinamidase